MSDQTNPPAVATNAPDRRQFLINASLVAGGLVVGIGTGGVAPSGGVAEAQILDGLVDVFAVLKPNAWVQITAAGEVVCILDRVEMGQGTMTAHAQIVADELGVDPADVLVKFAHPDRIYSNPRYGIQLTGGSTSTATSWNPLRLAGAATREMLTAAGARRLWVPASACDCFGGKITHRESGRSVPFADLAAFAALNIRVPRLAQPRSSFAAIGKSVPRLDSLAKVLGTATYGLDVKLPGLLTAVVIRPPAHGGKVVSFDDSKARDYWRAVGAEGEIFAISRGIAVVSSSYWLARQAASLVTTEFTGGSAPDFDGSVAGLAQRQGADSFDAPAATVDRRGNARRALEGSSGGVVEAAYEVPFLPHQTMEPMNCTAFYRGGRMEVWAPTQSPASAQEVAARAAGISGSDVTMHTTLIGGGFGRRISVDYVQEAAEITRALSRPVKVIWSREDDVQHDFYRPGMAARLRGQVQGGRIASWQHRIMGQSVALGLTNDFLVAALPIPLLTSGRIEFLGRVAQLTMDKDLIVDPFASEGADKIPYEIPNRLVQFRHLNTGIPAGFWRSVGHSHNAFAVESFVDELAAAAGVDAVAFRERMLSGQPRERGVLQKAAAMAGWSSPLPAPAVGKRGRGIALHSCFGSFCAIVVQVLIVDKTLQLEGIWCAVDCGFVVNPDIVRSQIEGAIVWGLSSTLRQKLSFKDGATQQSNFGDCGIMRYAEIPEIEIALLNATATGLAPTGIGEVAVPATGPAVANAVFQATGERIRRMPLGFRVQRVRSAPPAAPAPAPAEPATPAQPAEPVPDVDPALTASARDALSANCGSCHDAPAEVAGISNVSDMDALQKSRGLRGRYKRIIGKSMPPPVEQDGVFVSPISAEDTKAIFDWIDAVNKLPVPPSP